MYMYLFSRFVELYVLTTQMQLDPACIMYVHMHAHIDRHMLSLYRRTLFINARV